MNSKQGTYEETARDAEDERPNQRRAANVDVKTIVCLFEINLYTRVSSADSMIWRTLNVAVTAVAYESQDQEALVRGRGSLWPSGISKRQFSHHCGNGVFK